MFIPTTDSCSRCSSEDCIASVAGADNANQLRRARKIPSERGLVNNDGVGSCPEVEAGALPPAPRVGAVALPSDMGAFARRLLIEQSLRLLRRGSVLQSGTEQCSKWQKGALVEVKD